MLFQSSNPVSIIAEEDAASIAALRQRAERFKQLGMKEYAQQYNTRALSIVNKAMLNALTSGDFQPEDELFYVDSADDEPEQKSIQLTLLMVQGSPLAEKVLKVLREDSEEHGII